jgi:hypothetical protein
LWLNLSVCKSQLKKDVQQNGSKRALSMGQRHSKKDDKEEEEPVAGVAGNSNMTAIEIQNEVPTLVDASDVQKCNKKSQNDAFRRSTPAPPLCSN